jgi:flavorubredoxin
MSTWWPVPLDRVHAIRPGDRLPVGDRTLRAVAPPLFDNPMSIGALDEATGTLFSVDSFGALIPEATQDVTEIPQAALAGGMQAWGAIDSPWALSIDRSRFGEALDRIRQLRPTTILSSHLPAANGTALERFLQVLETVPDAEPAVPPSAEEFTLMLQAMAAMGIGPEPVGVS